MQKQHELED